MSFLRWSLFPGHSFFPVCFTLSKKKKRKLKEDCVEKIWKGLPLNNFTNIIRSAFYKTLSCFFKYINFLKKILFQNNLHLHSGNGWASKLKKKLNVTYVSVKQVFWKNRSIRCQLLQYLHNKRVVFSAVTYTQHDGEQCYHKYP